MFKRPIGSYNGVLKEISGGDQLPADVLPPNTQYITFNCTGGLTQGIANAKWYPPGNVTLSSIQSILSTVSTGSDVIYDVLKNGGTSITGGAGVDIPAGTGMVGPTAITPFALLATDYLVVSIIQIGSGIAGSNLAVRIAYS